jgi:hypothetical protein
VGFNYDLSGQHPAGGAGVGIFAAGWRCLALEPARQHWHRLHAHRATNNAANNIPPVKDPLNQPTTVTGALAATTFSNEST